MHSAFRFVAPPSTCGYLPDRVWSLEYEEFHTLSQQEYLERMRQGWRRFGYAAFRPRCPACQACQPIRVDVRRFRPNRSQRRVRKLNETEVRLEIGAPSVDRVKLSLFQRYHQFQAEAKGWPRHRPRDTASYRDSFVENPFPTLEWCYYLKDRLVGVGYVDDLQEALSAIYFYYDPTLRDRSLGTWNVLSILQFAAERGVPYVYLGYYIAGCGSMEYKARFVPNQILSPQGVWVDFRS